MSAAANKAIIRQALEGTAEGDGRAFVAMLSDVARWTIIGTTSWSRTFDGKPAILSQLLAPLAANFAGRNVVSAGRIVAEGDTVMAEGRNHSVTVNGERYDNRYAWVFTFRDGKVVDILEYCDTDLIQRVLASCPE